MKECFEKIGKILQEERIQKGLSIDDIFSKTRIPRKIIKNIEEDPEFFEKNPYAKLYIKQIAKVLDIDVDCLNPEESLTEKIKKLQEEEKPVVEQEEQESFRYKRALNFAGSLGIILALIVLSVSFKNKAVGETSAYKIILDSQGTEVSFNENNIKNEKDEKEQKKAKKSNFLGKSLILKAKSDVWITADIDGKKKVINLKAGEERLLLFEKKITFETIGNVRNLTIKYNDKNVVIRKEIVHNVFVDADGIFLNGYNLLSGMEKS